MLAPARACRRGPVPAYPHRSPWAWRSTRARVGSAPVFRTWRRHHRQRGWVEPSGKPTVLRIGDHLPTRSQEAQPASPSPAPSGLESSSQRTRRVLSSNALPRISASSRSTRSRSCRAGSPRSAAVPVGSETSLLLPPPWPAPVERSGPSAWRSAITSATASRSKWFKTSRTRRASSAMVVPGFTPPPPGHRTGSVRRTRPLARARGSHRCTGRLRAPRRCRGPGGCRAGLRCGSSAP